MRNWLSFLAFLLLLSKHNLLQLTSFFGDFFYILFIRGGLGDSWSGMIFNILRNILPRHLAFGIFFLNLTSKSSSRRASFPTKQPSRLPSLCPRPLLCGLMFSVCSYPSFACPLPSFFYIPLIRCWSSSPTQPHNDRRNGSTHHLCLPLQLSPFLKVSETSHRPHNIVLCVLILSRVCPL